MLNLTPVVRNIIILNVIVFILQNMFRSLHVTEILSLWNVGTENFRPYQLFSYMFVHGGFSHIFFNMLIFATSGSVLESYWGPQRLLLLYVVTGIGAGLFNMAIDYFFLNGNSFGYMLGASGAVYGVLMAYGMAVPDMELRFFLLPFTIKVKYFVFILGALAFFNSYSGVMGLGVGGGGNVAHLAHLGGMIFAFLMIQYWRIQGGRGRYF